MWRGKTPGFTLLEMLIAVAMLAVLLAVALPGYQESLRRARRSDAISSLLALSLRQEQRLLSAARYSADMRELGFADDPALSEQGYYALHSEPCPGEPLAACYLLSARPRPGSSQARDLSCTVFFLDARGRRSAQGARPGDCW